MKNQIFKEATQLWYWGHLAIIAVVVLGILQYFQGGQMLTIKNILWSIPLLGVGDITAHLIMGKT